MWDYIRGTLSARGEGFAVLDVGGIGYKILVSATALEALPPLETPVKLFVTAVIRETAQTLYGFLDQGSRACFETLIAVSGVGPKMALAVLSKYDAGTLSQLVFEQDSGKLSQVPGIGKKTAERLLVDLKGKLQGIVLSPSTTCELIDSRLRDALSALINLGYKRAQAESALQRALKEEESESDLATLIATAIQLANT